MDIKWDEEGRQREEEKDGTKLIQMKTGFSGRKITFHTGFRVRELNLLDIFKTREEYSFFVKSVSRRDCECHGAKD